MSERAVVVTGVGSATGSKAAAAAFACAASEVDRAGLLVDFGEGRPPRPSLVATAAARELEERLVAHLPEAGVASRGQTCHLMLPPDPGGVERLAGALAIVRDSVGAVHLPPALLQPVLEDARFELAAVLLRADLTTDRALVALAVGDLMERGIPVAVLKQPLGWIAARRALAGALPTGSVPGPERSAWARALESLPVSHACYAVPDDAEADPARAAQQQRRGDEGARRRRGLHRHQQRQAGR